MSQIGKKKIVIPNGVFANLIRNKIVISGIFGQLETNILFGLKLIKENNTLKIIQVTKNKFASSKHGLMHAILSNMITGVENKFFKIIKIAGIGFKFILENNNLILNVGKTNPTILSIPKCVNIDTFSSTQIKISSIMLEQLSLFSSQIRSVAPIEPYSGHGVHYDNEKIIRKPGKRKLK